MIGLPDAGMGAAARRLDAAGARQVASRVAEVMAAAPAPWMGNYLLPGLTAACARLDAAGAAAVADELLRAMAKARAEHAVAPLGAGLEAMAARLEPAQLARAIDLVTAAMERAKDPAAQLALADKLAALVRLAPSNAERAAAALSGCMRRAGTVTTLAYLARFLGDVSQHLGASQCDQHCLLGIDLLLAAGGNTTVNNAPLLRDVMQSLCARLPTARVVSLLRHPLASGPAREGLLAALGQRCRRSFATAWEFVDWTKGNGVSFDEVRAAGR
jgi:hypothetical protein